MNRPTAASQSEEPTLGFLHPLGSIARVRHENLLFCHEGKAELGSTFQHRTGVYSAAPLSEHWEEELRLPGDVEPYESFDGLKARIEAFLRTYLDLGNFASLVSHFAVSTSVPESLPSLSPLCFIGDPEEFAVVLEVLAWVVRCPLRLASVPSISALTEFPLGINPSFLLSGDPLKLKRLFPVISSSASLVLDGQLLTLRCPLVTLTPVPWTDEGMIIKLDPQPGYRRVQAADVATEGYSIQASLLDFRLSNWSRVARSEIDYPNFSPRIRRAARMLGSVSQGLDPQVLAGLEILQVLDEDDVSTDPNLMLVEVLLALVHLRVEKASVQEIADRLNALATSRGVSFEYKPKTIGGLLRAAGFVPRRSAGGRYAVPLSPDGVHALAHRFRRCTPESMPGCELCANLQPVVAVSTDLSQEDGMFTKFECSQVHHGQTEDL